MSDYIIPEVVTEILKRLPIKCLLRLRCVCKEWCSLISSPSFITQQLSYSSSTQSGTLLRYYSQHLSKEVYTVYNDTSSHENSFSISFPFHENMKHYYQIVGYCKGVLCLSDDFFWLRKFNTLVLWNPSIRRAVTLPNPNFYQCSRNAMLALGFGYDSKNNDFKVVRLVYFLDDDEGCHRLPPIVEVFSLLKVTWTRLNNNVECYVSDHCWSQAFICNYVHWVAFKMIKNDNSRCHRNLILKFDFIREKFIELRLPEGLTSVPPVKLKAMMIRERLSIVYNNAWTNNSLLPDQRDSCEIWVMKEYGNVESWSLLVKLKSRVDLYRVLDVRKGGIVFARRNGKLCFYSFHIKVATETGIIGTTYSFLVDKYVESLFLLGDGTEVRATELESGGDYEFRMVASKETHIVEAKTNQIYSLYLKP